MTARCAILVLRMWSTEHDFTKQEVTKNTRKAAEKEALAEIVKNPKLVRVEVVATYLSHPNEVVATYYYEDAHPWYVDWRDHFTAPKQTKRFATTKEAVKLYRELSNQDCLVSSNAVPIGSRYI